MYEHNRPDGVLRIARALADVRQIIEGRGSGNPPLRGGDKDPDGKPLGEILSEFQAAVNAAFAKQ
jgi:hypothetical protein